MTWRKLILALLLAAGANTAAVAASLDLNLNNDVVEGSYNSDPTTYQYRFGALYDDRHSDWLGHAGFVALGEHSSPQFRSNIGIGGRVYGGSPGPFHLLAVPLGGQFIFYPGNSPVGFGGYVYYAPNVLTGLDATRFYDLGARVEFEVIKPTVLLYIGYRKVEARFKSGGGTSTIDEGGHVGLQVRF